LLCKSRRAACDPQDQGDINVFAGHLWRKSGFVFGQQF
jgi:hypothetical protein